MTTIALLNIGSELLRGRTVNTNAARMAKMLRKIGFSLDRTVVVHDEGAAITQAIDQLMQVHDVLLVTGGLGPTRDDITKKVLLARFGGELMIDNRTLAHIESYLARNGRKLLESNRQQALVPSSCEVLFNGMGTAPGMAFRENGKTLIALPGVPYEMEHLMKSQVLPLLREQFSVGVVQTRIIRTAGVPESRIAERMVEIEGEIAAEISIAYLPGYDGTKIELRLEGAPAQHAEISRALTAAQALVANLFSKYVYSLEDKAPSQVLAERLLEAQLTFATAESCTGGAIAAALVQHTGVSAVLKGGVIAYMREIKEEMLGVSAATIDANGIVSQAVASAMAEGARKALGSDIAVAITGIAEAPPNAGEAESPQAWIGFADANGSSAFHIRLFGDRKVNLEVAKNAALIFVLRNLKGDED